MLPLSKQSKPRGRRKRKDGSPNLEKKAIVAAALKLIDVEGIENFSMRKLAKELNVYPTAIYWHLPNRNAVIGEVISSVLVDLVPDNFADDWKNGLIGMFRNYRDRVRAHPNIAPMIGAQLVSNTSVDFEMVESILSALSEAGFNGPKLRAAYNAVIAAMVAYTTQEFSLVPEDAKGEWSAAMQETIRGVDSQKYPITAMNLNDLQNRAFILRWENGTTAPLDDGFELYIHAFVDGLEAQLAQP
ncbi:TetR/AcrR family transcriptional regulator [Celeribacter sp. ULVN23_4]